MVEDAEDLSFKNRKTIQQYTKNNLEINFNKTEYLVINYRKLWEKVIVSYHDPDEEQIATKLDTPCPNVR